MDHTLSMKIHQGLKLSRHGVHSVVCLAVIIIVVGEWLVGVRVCSKGPEAIQMDIVAELHCQAGHHDASAEAQEANSLATPKFFQHGRVRWVKEDGLWATVTEVLY